MTNKQDIINTVLEYIREKNNRQINTDVVPVTGAKISPEDIAEVVSVALDGWFTEGKIAHEFEQRLARLTKSKSAVLCNSGSSANLIALCACTEVYPKRKFVVVPATSFPTTVFPIIQCGLIPLFVDTNIKTLNVFEEQVVHLLKRDDVAGTIIAHTLGFPFHAAHIGIAANLYGKFFIEDCCDALGADAGTYGDCATYSFFPAHQITSGEGGAVVINNPKLTKIARSVGSWGRACWCKPGDDNTCNKRFDWNFPDLPEGFDHKYTFERLGYNLKMTEMQAALGLSQMDRLLQFVTHRRANFETLQYHLWNDDTLRFFIQHKFTISLSSPFGFPITLTRDCPFTRNEIVSYLEANGIRTRPVFAGNIIKHPAMQGQVYYVDGTLEGSDYIMRNTFWVGVHPSLTLLHTNKIISTVNRFLEKYY